MCYVRGQFIVATTVNLTSSNYKLFSNLQFIIENKTHPFANFITAISNFHNSFSLDAFRNIKCAFFNIILRSLQSYHKSRYNEKDLKQGKSFTTL